MRHTPHSVRMYELGILSEMYPRMDYTKVFSKLGVTDESVEMCIHMAQTRMNWIIDILSQPIYFEQSQPR